MCVALCRSSRQVVCAAHGPGDLLKKASETAAALAAASLIAGVRK